MKDPTYLGSGNVSESLLEFGTRSSAHQEEEAVVGEAAFVDLDE